MKVSVVNSAGGSFYWNYASDTFYRNYAGDNACCIYAGFEVVLFVTGMLLDLSVAIMQLEVSVAHMQVKFLQQIWEFLLQLCRWYFLQCIMHMTVSVVLMQASLSFIAM